MNKLIQTIEMIRLKLPELRRHSLRETPTRTIVIDPLLESLGWDIRTPHEVQLEYPTIDGKSVDYALKLNKKPVLLVEAKALDDPLDDVKGITQVVGYAANDGIVWCLLTNGLRWRVYRSVEKCPAPDKLMFEVSLDPNDSDTLTVEQIAQQMWRFSQEEMAKGTLDSLGEQTFTDSKIRKALQLVMTDPPRSLLNLLRQAAKDDSLTPQQVKESLVRIAHETLPDETSAKPNRPSRPGPGVVTPPSPGLKRPKKSESSFSEGHHLTGKPQEVVTLYQALDRFCVSLDPAISKRSLKKVINYEYSKRCFCSVHLQQGGMRVWLRLKYSHIDAPPPFARDVSHVGHWGVGETEFRLANRPELELMLDLVRQSLAATKGMVPAG